MKFLIYFFLLTIPLASSCQIESTVPTFNKNCCDGVFLYPPNNEIFLFVAEDNTYYYKGLVDKNKVYITYDNGLSYRRSDFKITTILQNGKEVYALFFRNFPVGLFTNSKSKDGFLGLQYLEEFDNWEELKKIELCSSLKLQKLE